MNIRSLFLAVLALALPTLAYAGETQLVPEPATLTLLGAGIVAVVAGRARRTKK